MRRTGRHRGFTLVELLVVLGIITVLIAILVPTLSGARKSAQRTACLSNMRQLGNSLTLFTIEHRGYLPKAWYNDGINYGDMSSERWGYRDPMWGWDYVLQRYIRNKDVFRCPSDEGGTTRGLWNDGYAGLPDKPDADNIPASYRMNLSDYVSWGIALKIFKIPKPAQAIYLLEGTPGLPVPMDNWHHVATWEGIGPTSAGGHVGKNYTQNVAYNRHNKGANYVFADGHAEWMLWKDTWQPVGAPVKPNTVPTRWRQRFDGKIASEELNWYTP